MQPIEERIESVVDRILEDYGKQRDIDRLESFRSPDKDVIIDIIEKLRRIIFPGYFLDKGYRFYNQKNNLSMLIEDVVYHLTKQVRLVFESKGQSREEANEAAQELCLQFFDRLPEIRAYVQTDLQAAYDGDPAASDMAEIIYSYPGLFAITVFRLAHALFELGVPMIPRIMTEYAHGATGIDIHPGATIGKYFFIDHGTGIVIGETTVIGENVKIYQGVTLGALSTRGGQSLHGVKRHPTIEDNVTIYAGASILGGETVIGANSVISSNVFVTESVAPGTAVRNKKQELQFKVRKSK
ncbi:MAG: serine acetyltransferase [Oscillospiraceae bacterium]|nr:serine acetyltransferase [Oscillospiraceae bacterium]